LKHIDLILEFTVAYYVLHIYLLNKNNFPIAELNILENDDQLRNPRSNDTGHDTKRDMICSN